VAGLTSEFLVKSGVTPVRRAACEVTRQTVYETNSWRSFALHRAAWTGTHSCLSGREHTLGFISLYPL